MWDLKKAENSDGLIELQDFELEVGQDVEILHGPLAGRIGKLLRMDPGNRVTVLLEMLGHLIKGQINREAIVRI